MIKILDMGILKSYIPVILIRSYLTISFPSAFGIIIQGEPCPGNTAVAFEFNYNCISENINCVEKHNFDYIFIMKLWS